ncbi:NAD(P)-binding protein [Xylariomycetidae sp. FL0641]|nr:NAD(P)-binding protein [Xylariomycetidae sp. FL0641]
MTSNDRTLLLIGSGPGIGQSVATLFASKRFTKVALVARNAEKLAAVADAVKKSSSSTPIEVKTYPVDVVDADAFKKALDSVEADLGKPECIYYNAARVLPSPINPMTHDVQDIEYDFKINNSALYLCAQRYVPELLALAKQDSAAMPALIVTSSMLPQNPLPFVFALSMVKAAQRNLMQSLWQTYGSGQGVLLGLVNVAGQVSPEDKVWNPANIAAKAWEWYETQSREENPSFEVLI